MNYTTGEPLQIAKIKAENKRLTEALAQCIEGHDKLAKRVGALDAVIRSFADEENWSDRPGCLQWMGKRHAIEYAQSVLENAPVASKITEEVAGDLSEHDKAKINAAWERHERAGEPDWPPRMSAVGLRDGTLCRGSTGQTFEVRNGQWCRLFI